VDTRGAPARRTRISAQRDLVFDSGEGLSAVGLAKNGVAVYPARDVSERVAAVARSPGGTSPTCRNRFRWWVSTR